MSRIATTSKAYKVSQLWSAGSPFTVNLSSLQGHFQCLISRWGSLFILQLMRCPWRCHHRPPMSLITPAFPWLAWSLVGSEGRSPDLNSLQTSDLELFLVLCTLEGPNGSSEKWCKYNLGSAIIVSFMKKQTFLQCGVAGSESERPHFPLSRRTMSSLEFNAQLCHWLPEGLWANT